MIKIKNTLFLLTFLLSVSLVAQDSFVRSAVIDVPAIENGGYGNVVAGVDFDGDGKLEIYAINNNWSDSGAELVPRIYKYEFSGTSWDSVWSATLDIPLQNTWPTLLAADLDKDGKKEIVWGVVNNLGTGNEDPSRVVVFETPGDGSDNMGVSDGAGGWAPNARWNLDVPASTEMRGFSMVIDDFDGDGVDEMAIADRKNYYFLGIFSVDNIPDNADGSETWTLEYKGSDVQENQFTRNGKIVSPDGGFGNVVAGMDYDGDGLIEMYAVNNDASDGTNGELIPTLFKYEYVANAWVKKWETTVPNMTLQNTWPILLAGDWDKDGKGEIIWTPINNNDATINPDADRIIVYEFPGDSTSDAMGVDQGDGTWAPNAAWNMDVPEMTEMRPQRGVLTDIDNDGTDEFIFAERKDYYGWGVLSVNDIPDLGDGSETWTMEAHGTGAATGGSNYRDVLVDDNMIYVFDWNGDVTSIKATGTSYDSVKTQKVGPAWAWNSANVVDLDGDGTNEIVVGDYGSSGTHSVMLLQNDGDSLVSSVIADFSANTANRITSVRVGNIDADSLAEFVVGFRGTDEVYKIDYLGGSISDPANYATSLLDAGITGADAKGQIDVICLANIDDDAADEVFYAGYPRSIDENVLDMGVGDFGDVSVDYISYGSVLSMNGGESLMGVSYHGDLYPVKFDTSSYKLGHVQKGLKSANTWISANNYDVDGDGRDEIFLSGYTDANVVMYKETENGGFQAYPIADLSSLGAVRTTGGAAGDMDGDGNLDLIFGSRESTPLNAVYRVKYTGGDPTDMNSWSSELIDSDILAAAGQIDQIKLANMDDDADLEVVYTGIPRNSALLPIVVLDLLKVQSENIADVKIDADGDFMPDRIGEVVTVKGVIISPTINSLFSLSINIQDETGGINIYSSVDSISTTVGDLVQITGTIDNYNGLTEIVVADKADIVRLGTGTIPTPMVVSAAELMANGEKYESTLVQINAVAATDAGDAWPASGSDANVNITDGSADINMRVDKDLDLAGQAEPVYPANVIGVVTQYDSNTPPNAGYQILPRYYADIEQNVAAPPSPYFFFTDETAAMYDGKTVQVNSNEDEFTFAWDKPVDLNGDALIYQFQMIVDGTAINYNAADTFMVLTGQQIVSALSNTNKTVEITVRTKGAESALVNSVDTLSVSFDILVGVNDQNMIPKEFFVDQNYPNPFNPTTNIKFGLPAQAEVNLVIYDILGREVARLVNNRVMNAGTYEFSFNASKLASGTYIYRLQADQKVEVKKMMLLK